MSPTASGVAIGATLAITALVFTSINGVAAFAALTPDRTRPVFAVGDATAMTAIKSVPAQALAGRIKVTAIDYGVQEGARHFSLAGGGPQAIELRSSDPVDLSRESNGDVMLLATLRLDAPQGSDLTLGVTCGAGCGGSRPLSAGTLPVGKWRVVGIPLKCFAATNGRTGADVKAIDAPFVLRTSQTLEISLARVSLGMVADDVLACQP